jgi:hypothetical protein
MQIDRILPPGTTPMAPRAFLEALKLLLLSISLFTTFSICSPTAPRIKRLALDDGTQDQKQQDGLFSVLGVAGLTGPESHPRLEIRELEKNEDQWNVYLIGLRRFQSVDSNDKLSYYQVSGTLHTCFLSCHGSNEYRLYALKTAYFTTPSRFKSRTFPLYSSLTYSNRNTWTTLYIMGQRRKGQRRLWRLLCAWFQHLSHMA